MSSAVIGKLKSSPEEINWTQLTPKVPPAKEITDAEPAKAPQPPQPQPAQSPEKPYVPPIVTHISKKEPKFFSEPKKVKKKTEGSILAFQILTSLIFCLLLFLSRIGAPQLYDNLHIFLTRIFQ